MRNLNPEDVSQLITINVMMIRVSQLIPEMHGAFFQCQVCPPSGDGPCQSMGMLPYHPQCGADPGLLVTFSDKQMIKLQESPENMPAGQMPHAVILLVTMTLLTRFILGTE